jgi:hypothetical protein
VTDGVTIGHPCCGVHDCDIPLTSVKHRFCPQHYRHELVCSVTLCEDATEPGFRTCTSPDHRQIELAYDQRGKAMFQLKHRLERLKLSQPSDSLPTIPRLSQDEDLQPDDETDFADGEGVFDLTGYCEDKPEGGNRAVRARFGRRRTHNEELCVASCGVILGRATFFGSEAPNGVRVCCPLHL